MSVSYKETERMFSLLHSNVITKNQKHQETKHQERLKHFTRGTKMYGTEKGNVLMTNTREKRSMRDKGN